MSDVSMEGSLASLSPPGGYPIDSILTSAPIDKKYLCGKCKLILREPMQSFCGHRFCKSCSNELIRLSQQQTGDLACPACSEEGLNDEYCVIKAEQLFPDNAMKREFTHWKAKCLNTGCDWQGLLNDYNDHLNTCAYKMTTCECGELIPFSQIANHQANECRSRQVECAHCHNMVQAIEQDQHLRICPKVPFTCDVCAKELCREQLKHHYAGECSVRRDECPYGCGRFIDPSQKEAHERDASLEHLRDLNVRVHKIEEVTPHIASASQLNLIDAQPILPIQVSREIQQIESKVAKLENKITTALGQTTFQGMSQQASSPSTSTSAGAQASSGSSADEVVRELERKIRLMDEKVSAYENGTAVLEQSIERGSTLIETVDRTAGAERKALEQRIKQLERNLAIKDMTVAELEQRLKTLEVSSYDGILLWKISDVARKRQEAISNRTTSIYSPPFYTSRTGYKMCARLYLNGDGMGKGSYLSLFFVVMRNGYDALMRWPFRQKVTLILIDQNNRDHIIDAFKPDPSSSSFRRPMSEMNIASGCPLFCPLSSLQSDQYAYVKDDTMYIKIIVDTADLNITT